MLHKTISPPSPTLSCEKINLESTNKLWLRNLPANMPTHIAEDRDKRYVANQDTIGSTPVTTKAIAEAIAQPRYTDDE